MPSTTIEATVKVSKTIRVPFNNPDAELFYGDTHMNKEVVAYLPTIILNSVDEVKEVATKLTQGGEITWEEYPDGTLFGTATVGAHKLEFLTNIKEVLQPSDLDGSFDFNALSFI